MGLLALVCTGSTDCNSQVLYGPDCSNYPYYNYIGCSTLTTTCKTDFKHTHLVAIDCSFSTSCTNTIENSTTHYNGATRVFP